MSKDNESNSNMQKENKKFNFKLLWARSKRKILTHYKLVRVVGLTLVGVLIILIFSFFGKVLSNPTLLYYRSILTNFVLAPTGSLPSLNGRVNVLILGKGGLGHEAPDLTDTMIFTSIGFNGEDIFSLSLPRDIWIPELRAKLNSAYYWGKQKSPGGGIILAKSEVEKIVGMPVHYAVVFDFGTFKNVVDDLGGIDVEVENPFIDEKYPIAGRENDLCDGDVTYSCRYETIKFEKGRMHMDGETALKFVRSRNAEGDEGTDIAREARQQRVIAGVKKAVTSREFLLDFKKVRSLYNTVISSIETDITVPEAASLARKIILSKSQNSFVIPEEFLLHPPSSKTYDFQYVFIPQKGISAGKADWSQLQDWIRERINEKN